MNSKHRSSHCMFLSITKFAHKKRWVSVANSNKEMFGIRRISNFIRLKHGRSTRVPSTSKNLPNIFVMFFINLCFFNVKAAILQVFYFVNNRLSEEIYKEQRSTLHSSLTEKLHDISKHSKHQVINYQRVTQKIRKRYW